MEEEHKKNGNRSHSLDIGPVFAIIGSGPSLVPGTQESLATRSGHNPMTYYAQLVLVTFAKGGRFTPAFRFGLG
jgi:hypothetical protein